MIKNICFWGVVIGLTLASAACNKSSDGGTAAAASGTTAAATTTAAAAAKKPKATLKTADVKALYKAEVDNDKMNVPIDKKVAAMAAKLPAPAADTGRKKTYYALDGDKCTKFELDNKDGSLSDQSTDKSDCGL